MQMGVPECHRSPPELNHLAFILLSPSWWSGALASSTFFSTLRQARASNHAVLYCTRTVETKSMAGMGKRVDLLQSGVQNLSYKNARPVR